MTIGALKLQVNEEKFSYLIDRHEVKTSIPAPFSLLEWSL